MNGKVVFGSDFAHCLEYILEKDEAQLLDTNLAGTSIPELASEFRHIANRSGRIVKPVMHLSLSPHPDDVLENENKLRFTHQLLTELGMGNCQYLIAEHQDTITPEGQARPHLHVIANRIPLDQSKAVNSSWMKRRVEKALQKLRDEFGLQPVVASWDVERSAPSTGQTRRYRREQQEYEQGTRSTPPQLPIKVQLQDAIDLASTTHPTLPELILDLQRQGVETKVYFNQSHAIGISYSKEGIAFKGSALGKAYSLPGLQQYRNVTYQPPRDNPLIKQLREHSLDAINELTTMQASSHKDSETKACSNPLQPKNEADFGAIANTLTELELDKQLSEKSKKWQKARKQLQLDYGIPQALSQVLYEQGQLATNAEGKAIFVKQSINGVFWFSTGSHPQRIIITESPIEAVFAFLVEDAKAITKPTVYLGIEPGDEIPSQFLKQFDDVLISVGDEEFEKRLEKIVSKAKFVTLLEGSWQDTWQSQQSTKQSQQRRRSLEVSRQRQLQL